MKNFYRKYDDFQHNDRSSCRLICSMWDIL